MKTKDVERFEESIRHYRRILNLVLNELPIADQCPLCQHYFKDDCTDGGDNLCPIAKRAGAISCQNTPWYGAFSAYSRRKLNGRDWYTDEEYVAIEFELKWLKSFLPTLHMISYV